MIRVNNEPIALQYLTATHTPLTTILLLQTLAALLWLTTLLTQPFASKPFESMWWLAEGYLWLGMLLNRNKIRKYPDPSRGQVALWRKDSWRWLLRWRFVKLLALILSLFAFLKSVWTMASDSPEYLNCSLLLLSMVSSFWTLVLTNRVLLLLRRLNRVFSNFLSDFGEEQREDEQRQKQVPANVKILRDVYSHS